MGTVRDDGTGYPAVGKDVVFGLVVVQHGGYNGLNVGIVLKALLDLERVRKEFVLRHSPKLTYAIDGAVDQVMLALIETTLIV